MKQVLNIIALLLALTGCKMNNSDTKKNGALPETGAAKPDAFVSEKPEASQPDSSNEKSIFIKDSADYSASFLNEMERLGAKNIALVDSFMILGNTDTIRFPQEPRIGERIVLTARKDHLAIALTVKRLNQTAIDYKVELVEFGNANYTTRGQAEISLYDYVSSQTGLKDEANWSDFPAAFDHLQDTCYLNIMLDRQADRGQRLVAKINKNCNGKIADLGWDNFPELLEK